MKILRDLYLRPVITAAKRLAPLVCPLINPPATAGHALTRAPRTGCHAHGQPAVEEQVMAADEAAKLIEYRSRWRRRLRCPPGAYMG